MDTLNIQEISYDRAVQDIMAGSVQYAGILTVHTAPGEELENTYIPPTYVRYSDKLKRPPDRNSKLYYPLGKDNLLPNFILDLKGRSTLLATVIGAVADAAMGKGMTLYKEDALSPDQRDQDKIDFLAWAKNVAIDRNFIRQIFENMATFKGFYIEYAYDEFMDEESELNPELSKLYCVNFHKARKGLKNREGEVEKYWLHRHAFDNRRRRWRQEMMALMAHPGAEEAHKLVKNKVTTITGINDEPFFDMDDEATSSLGRGRFMSFHYAASISSDEYPISDLATDAVINAAIIDAYLPQFDVAGLENGLSVGHIVTVPLARPKKGDKKGEEKYEKDKVAIRTDLQKSMQGVENSDNVLVVYVDPRSENQPITIAEVPNNNTHETLNEKDERKERTILTAFRVRHPALVGLPPRAGKGLNAQTGILHEAEGQWYASYVYKLTEVVEDFFTNVIIPIWEFEERGGRSTGLQVKFPMDQRFKREVPNDIILKTFTVKMIYEHYGIEQEYTPEHQMALVKDLLTRSLGGNTADPKLLAALGIIPKEAVPDEPTPPEPNPQGAQDPQEPQNPNNPPEPNPQQ